MLLKDLNKCWRHEIETQIIADISINNSVILSQLNSMIASLWKLFAFQSSIKQYIRHKEIIRGKDLVLNIKLSLLCAVEIAESLKLYFK
jgi:hypothetical protein